MCHFGFTSSGNNLQRSLASAGLSLYHAPGFCQLLVSYTFWRILSCTGILQTARLSPQHTANKSCQGSALQVTSHAQEKSSFGVCNKMRSHVSREKYPVHKFITQTFTISFNWGRLHPDKGHRLWNLYSELLLLCPTAEQKLPTMWARPCSYHIRN